MASQGRTIITTAEGHDLVTIAVTGPLRIEVGPPGQIVVSSEHTLTLDGSNGKAIKISAVRPGNIQGTYADAGSVAIGSAMSTQRSRSSIAVGASSGDLFIGNMSVENMSINSHGIPAMNVVTSGPVIQTPQKGEGTILVVPPGMEVMPFRADPVSRTDAAIHAGVTLYYI